ncbi:MAG TPA: FixH family protein [Anaerolineales bacterium]|nr:FixH family protein [Anaerolineales bacterium]
MKQSNSKANRLRVTLWIAGIVVAAALVYFAGMNLMMARMNSNLPSELDYSTMRNSNNDLYRVSYHASTDSVPVNQMHQWTLHVETLDGQPVENAAITVDGDMPQHGHGLPTRPQVTQYLGNGDYLVEGVKFQMGGWWVMDFTITAAGQTDVVRFNMVLP